MKNLKKVLALAVAFVMCFTMFAGAAVYSDVPAGSDYSEAVTLLSDLGIIAGLPDGSFGVNQTITRADAACLIARMLTGETMPSKWAGASNFTDVPKDAYYESAVAYCAIMGITSGTSTTLGTYSPAREITDGEFIAMITRALGYDSAENPLSFPMGNIARAQQEGLLDNVNVVADSPALRGEDAMMIYNALFAEYDAYIKQVNIYQGADDHGSITIAEKVFGLDRLARVESNNKYVNMYKNEINTNNRTGDACLAHTWVVVGVDPRDAVNTYTAYPISDKTNAIDLDELDEDEEFAPITFVYEGDPSAILGYQVELWGELDHNGVDQKIKAVKTVKGQTGYDWQLSDGEDGADKLTVSGGTVNAEDAPIAVSNIMTEDPDKGDEQAYIHTELTKDEFNAFDLFAFDSDENDWEFKDGDTYRLFDWDSDGEIDFGIKTIRKYAEITDIDNENITFAGIVAGKDDEVEFDIDADQLKFNCSNISEGDVVELTATRAYDKSAGGEVVTVNVSKVSSQIAELTKVSTKGTLQMTFDGVVREMAEGDDRWDLVEDDDNNLDESDLEGTYEIWLDENGFIVKLIESDTNSGYLVALEVENGVYKTSKARSERAVLKAKLDDNTVDAFEVSFDLDIVGTAYDANGNYREKRNINNTTTYDDNGIANVPLYSSSVYTWLAPELVVGQVYKYWMDSDKVITKLERVTETKANEVTYWQNTGVVTVDTTEDFKGNTFINGNVYLKNSNVLFITDDDFVQYGVSTKHPTGVWADEDKVLSIAPTTANLKAISLANNSTVTLADKVPATPFGASVALYRSVTTANDTAVKNVAYDIDKNGYATAAIMAIDNFNEFNKNTTVALITDVSAQNRNNTIFEIEGAVAGKVGTFTSVVKDGGVSDMFYYFDPDNDDEVAYTSLTDIRNDIDDNGLYAEVSLDSDGKISKVVVMTEVTSKDSINDVVTSNVASKNYVVVRVGAGIAMEVGADGYASFISGTSGESILRYAASTTDLVSTGSVQWQRTFDVDGSTNIYTISNKLDKVLKGDAYEYLQSGKDGFTNLTAEPTIKEATASGIVSSTNKNTNTVDKYAVMDVAFDRDDVLTKGGSAPNFTYGWSNGTLGSSLNGNDAVAVFSFTKRFGEGDADDAILLALNSANRTLALDINGVADVTTNVVVDYELINNVATITKAEFIAPNGTSKTGTVSAPVNNKGTISIAKAQINASGEWTLKITDKDGNVYDDFTFTVQPYAVAANAKLDVEPDAGNNNPIAGTGDTLSFDVANAAGVAPAGLTVTAPAGFTNTYTSGTLQITVDNTVSAGDYTVTLRDTTTGYETTIVVTVERDTAANAISGASTTATVTGKKIEIASVNTGWSVSKLTKDMVTVDLKDSLGNEISGVEVKSVSFNVGTSTLTIVLGDDVTVSADDVATVTWEANGYCESGDITTTAFA